MKSNMTVPNYRFALTGVWTAWGVLSMNAWIWSSIFHTRDTPWTERMVCAEQVVAYAPGRL